MISKNTILSILCAFFAALYFVHPLIQIVKNRNTAPVKSAIINPAEKNDIVQIALTAADGSKITISKNGNLWMGQIEGLDAVFPCTQPLAASFIEELTAIKKTYRISRGEGNVFTDGTADFLISWTIVSGITKSVYLGGRDFSGTMRFIKAENGAVSKIESGFDAYLDTSARFWCDPYIIPRIRTDSRAPSESIQRLSLITDGKRIALIPGTDDFTPRTERILSLRHGGLSNFTPSPNENPALRIEAEFSNGESISVPVYRADDGNYLLDYDLLGGALHYSAAISERTYHNLRTAFSQLSGIK